MQVQSSKTYSSALNFSALDPARCHLCSVEVHHVVHRWWWLRWAALAVPLPTFLALLPPTHFATVGGKRGWSENRTGHFPHTIQHTSTFLLVEAFLPLQFTPPFFQFISKVLRPSFIDVIWEPCAGKTALGILELILRQPGWGHLLGGDCAGGVVSFFHWNVFSSLHPPAIHLLLTLTDIGSTWALHMHHAQLLSTKEHRPCASSQAPSCLQWLKRFWGWALAQTNLCLHSAWEVWTQICMTCKLYVRFIGSISICCLDLICFSFILESPCSCTPWFLFRGVLGLVLPFRVTRWPFDSFTCVGLTWLLAGTARGSCLTF